MAISTYLADSTLFAEGRRRSEGVPNADAVGGDGGARFVSCADVVVVAAVVVRRCTTRSVVRSGFSVILFFQLFGSLCPFRLYSEKLL